MVRKVSRRQFLKGLGTGIVGGPVLLQGLTREPGLAWGAEKPKGAARAIKKISLEEHFLIDFPPPVYSSHYEKLHDLGEGRLRERDEADIDMQVLFPGLLYARQLEAPGGDGTFLAKRINDTLSKAD